MIQMQLDQGPPKKRHASRLVLDADEHVDHMEETYEDEQVVDDVDQAVVVDAAEQAEQVDVPAADDPPVKRGRGRPRRTGKVTSKNDLQCAACGKLFATSANARKHEMQGVCSKPASRDPHRIFVPGPAVREIRHRNGRGTPFHRRALEPEVVSHDELETRRKVCAAALFRHVSSTFGLPAAGTDETCDQSDQVQSASETRHYLPIRKLAVRHGERGGHDGRNVAFVALSEPDQSDGTSRKSL